MILLHVCLAFWTHATAAVLLICRGIVMLPVLTLLLGLLPILHTIVVMYFAGQAWLLSHSLALRPAAGDL